jgi:hypothetical protein
MSSVARSPPDQGQLVSVRSRQWVVTDVRPSTLPPPLKRAFGVPQHLLTLASVEDDGLGEELQVIWEIEPGARVIGKVALPEPAGILAHRHPVNRHRLLKREDVDAVLRHVERPARRTAASPE